MAERGEELVLGAVGALGLLAVGRNGVLGGLALSDVDVDADHLRRPAGLICTTRARA